MTRTEAPKWARFEAHLITRPPRLDPTHILRPPPSPPNLTPAGEVIERRPEGVRATGEAGGVLQTADLVIEAMTEGRISARMTPDVEVPSSIEGTHLVMRVRMIGLVKITFTSHPSIVAFGRDISLDP
eukprot:Blabericola_migrator_1__8554@NODE_4471_length_1138_cov_83_919701_g37_i1_p2_GENE_NODE_4471_length_1138_cov_83_919701_g37_i1NODE_4471_length_1138_cov_83_919701_g37_i1_p2_ORF_typecomplete_len128_score0_18_NODE_4471_length_1138_cov_83_919701_g37_i1332715